MKYEAFLSYARVPDLALAAALGRSLQSFARPWNRVRAVDVFRDQTNLSSVGGLARGVTRGIDESEFLILLACPESAKSYWVMQELMHWCERKSIEKIVLVLTGGAAQWNRDTGDFDWEKTTALPACLGGRFVEEPLWLDLTWTRGIEKPTIDDARFLNAVGELSAIIRGVPKEQLIGEDVRQHRKLLVLQRAAIAALTVLTVTAAVSAVTALQQRNRAVANADKAEVASKLAHENEALAEQRQGIAERERAEADRQREQAILQRSRAERESAAAAAATATAIRQRNRAETERERAEDTARLNAATSLLDRDPTSSALILLELHNAARDELRAVSLIREVLHRVPASEVLRGHQGLLTSAAFSADGGRILTASLGNRTARVWRVDGRGTPLVFPKAGQAAFSPDGTRVATTIWTDSALRVWRADRKGDPLILRGHEEGLYSAAFSPDGSRIVTASIDKTARVWPADGQGEPIVLRGHTGKVNTAVFSPDGARILTTGSDRTARVWSADGRGKPVVMSEAEATHDIRGASFSPDGTRILLFVGGGHTWVWKADGIGEPELLQGDTATFSPDGRTVATASDDHSVRLLPVNGRGEPVVLRGHTATVSGIAFSPDGTRVVSASADGTVRLWPVDGRSNPVVLPGTPARWA
jgi:Tol biopolymer transport system component